ncbi:MAG TPA: hypothetical protein VGD81_16100 [Opitutaceae bacterium]
MLALLSLFAIELAADPLSKKQEIDFFRDVPSRSLRGLGARSDGRLIAGPVVKALPGSPGADLLWALDRADTRGEAWFVGTGPDGKILRVNTAARPDIAVETVLDLDETNILALRALSGGRLLAGTSPQGTLVLAENGKVVARVSLPVDSIFDLDLSPDGKTALVATGNPGRIYKVDVATLAKAGDSTEKVTSKEGLAAKGITLFGEIRDRNVRRIHRLPDGSLVAGSAPRGNVYRFPAAGGAPRTLLENRDAEASDFLVLPDGSFYAAITFSSAPSERRIIRTPSATTAPSPSPSGDEALSLLDTSRTERFSGRGQLVWFPADGFPETVATRTGVAFYRLARHGDLIVIAGGEQGELLAYDPVARRSLTLEATPAAQLLALTPAGPESKGVFLALGNNPAELYELSFAAAAQERRVETRRLDLGAPAELGQLRFARLRNLTPEALRVEARVSYAADEVEGWSEWTALAPKDGGWFSPGLRGRYVQLRLTFLKPDTAGVELDKASLAYLPQNHRPSLQDFRVIPPNFALLAREETSVSPPLTTLGQLVGASRDEEKRAGGSGSFLSSPIVPSPGTQVVYWSLSDVDGDTITATFSMRRDEEKEWTDMVVDTTDSYAQFDTTHLADGTYLTRLTAREQAPRAAADRLTVVFEADDLVIDHTPPEIQEATAVRKGERLAVTVRGRDARSLLVGVEFVFNNGFKTEVEQPLDGILDGHEETFVLDAPASKTAGATSVEVILYDEKTNSAARRIALPK